MLFIYVDKLFMAIFMVLCNGDLVHHSSAHIAMINIVHTLRYNILLTQAPNVLKTMNIVMHDVQSFLHVFIFRYVHV